MGLGEVIRQERKAQKLTQIELAKKANISVNSLRLYEAGKREPRSEQLQAIANALGTTPATLWLFATDPNEIESDSLSHQMWKSWIEVIGDLEALRDSAAMNRYSGDEPLIMIAISYFKLNSKGRDALAKYANILTYYPDYQDDKKDSVQNREEDK